MSETGQMWHGSVCGLGGTINVPLLSILSAKKDKKFSQSSTKGEDTLQAGNLRHSQ